MKKVIVNVEHSGKNFAAYIDQLPGCTTTGSSVSEIESNMREAIAGHIEVAQEYGDKVPAVFLGKYELVLKFDTAALLAIYKGVFTMAALERLTGIPQRQLQHYSSELKKPRPAQSKKIVEGFHKLGRELLTVDL
jgi:predicted RNase H-like HicB family nuclease